MNTSDQIDNNDDEKSYMKDGKMVVPWKLKDGTIINLLTSEEYNELPFGIELTSISGEKKIKTTKSKDDGDPDYIDLDTRAGRIAWGIPK